MQTDPAVVNSLVADAHTETGPRVGILTSGGDSPGMNAAIRAVVRTTLHLGGVPFAVHEGWAGAVVGGAAIRALQWSDVSGVLHRGGTVLGTARCPEFRSREGQLAAVRHLVEHGIDRLVVIGGDGSLRGAEELRTRWAELLGELVERGELPASASQAHPRLSVAGLVGSIDNDMVGTQMTIGADTALHRICDALDALRSTAASHQRAFVVEVMGRHCGYLALMAAVAGGADAVLVPEAPPGPGWQDDLVERLTRSRESGLRDLLVVVAEGAVDDTGAPITSAAVGDLLSTRLGGDGARVTILGHVQRGGRPSAYDRWMPTLLGARAAREVLAGSEDPAEGPSEDPTGDSAPAVLVGIRHNRASTTTMPDAVAATNAVKDAFERLDFPAAQLARGRSFATLADSFDGLCRPPADQGPAGRRIGVLHAGGLAPGMNTAVRALVRSAAVAGDVVVGVQGSVPGLVDGSLRELGWAEVDDWVDRAGAELGTRRVLPGDAEVTAIAGSVAAHRLDALVLIGGTEAWRTAAVLEASGLPELTIPLVCVPATIDNNSAGAELTIGADTALNTIVEALDKLRTTASATRRCFVVETMGGPSGYLPLMAGLAAGAERAYLPEDDVTIHRLAEDAARMTQAFAGGRAQWLTVRGEEASEHYSTDVMARIFEEEGGELFDVRQVVLGHVQGGACPTPFDRLLATRLAQAALAEVHAQLGAGSPRACLVGEMDGATQVTALRELEELLEPGADRPRTAWWHDLRAVGRVVNDDEPPLGNRPEQGDLAL